MFVMSVSFESCMKIRSVRRRSFVGRFGRRRFGYGSWRFFSR